MNRLETIARVKLLGATAARPIVDDATVGTVVDQHSLPDATGLAPSAPGWAPVYDVNAATAEVWRIKAGMVAGDYNFGADDARFDKGDVLAHCLEMEAKYAAMAGSATGIGTGGGMGTIQVGGTTLGYTTALDRIAATVVP